MQLSTKARYGLAVAVRIAQSGEQVISAQKLAQELSLSKIYLEQILARLKSHRLVETLKGPTGGYRIPASGQITVYDLLSALEPELFFEEERELADERLRHTLNTLVYGPVANQLKSVLSQVSLADLVRDLQEEPMYFI